MNLLFAALAYVLIVSAPDRLWAAHSGPIGRQCRSGRDCGNNAVCRRPSTCNGQLPVCQCLAGYFEDPQSGYCLLPATLGQACLDHEQEVACAPDNSVCSHSTGRCECRSGYKPGPSGQDCILRWHSQFFEEPCRSSVQCLYNMTCDAQSLLCSCPQGTHVDPDSHAMCIKNELGGMCIGGADCPQRHADCSAQGVCACKPGFEVEQLLVGSVDAPSPMAVCVSPSTPRLAEGEQCAPDYAFIDARGLCASGLVCQQPCLVCSSRPSNSVPPVTTEPLPETTSQDAQLQPMRVPMHGDTCQSNSDCQLIVDSGSAVVSVGMRCRRPWSSFCQPDLDFDGGRCACEDGYYVNGTSSCNKKPVGSYLGQACFVYKADEPAGNCVVARAVCAGGECICEAGYKPGPRGDDCVSNWRTQLLGEPCHDSVQCHYNLRCVNGTCSCLGVGTPAAPIDRQPGSPTAECLPVQAGDRCSDDSDCSGVANAGCSAWSRRCECRLGFVATTVHLRTPDDATRWCLADDTRLRNQGEECILEQPPDAHLAGTLAHATAASRLCATDLYCAACDEKAGSWRGFCLARDVDGELATTTTQPIVAVFGDGASRVADGGSGGGGGSDGTDGSREDSSETGRLGLVNSSQVVAGQRPTEFQGQSGNFSQYQQVPIMTSSGKSFYATGNLTLRRQTSGTLMITMMMMMMTKWLLLVTPRNADGE